MAGSSWPSLVAGAKAKASEVELKFDWLEGDIVPMIAGTKTDDTYNLGESAYRFKNAYFSGQIYLNGTGDSETKPSISWAANSTTGFYLHATITSGIGVSISGTNTASFGLSTTAITNQLTVLDGSVGVPGIGFSNDPNNGLYRIGTDDFAVTVGGVKTMEFKSDGTILTPVKAYFEAGFSASTADVTGDGTIYTLTSYYEVADQGSNFSGGVFVVPANGKYLFNWSIYLSDITTTVTYAYGLLYVAPASGTMPSGNLISGSYKDLQSDPPSSTSLNGSGLISLEANDRVYLTIRAGGGTKVVDIAGGISEPGTTTAFVVTKFSGMQIA